MLCEVLLCPSREISQWPPGSRYPVQKQESFYYQAPAGAPTNIDAAAIGRSSGLHCLCRVFSREKFEKPELRGWETSNWLPSVEGLGVGFWLVPISGAGHGFWLVPIVQVDHSSWALSQEILVWGPLAPEWWGEVRGFPKALFPEPYKMEFFC